MKRLLFVLLIVFLLVLVAVSCGDDVSTTDAMKATGGNKMNVGNSNSATWSTFTDPSTNRTFQCLFWGYANSPAVWCYEPNPPRSLTDVPR